MVNSNQSSTVWQVEFRCTIRGAAKNWRSALSIQHSVTARSRSMLPWLNADC